MSFGLTTDGLVIKRLTDIKTEIESSLRSELGSGINLLPTELLGQMVGIVSEREALIWELLEVVHNAFYPDTANGVSLDNVVAITGIKRLEATKADGTVTVEGDIGTVINTGDLSVSVDGNADYVFTNTAPATIADGTDEVQNIAFTDTPDAGTFVLSYDGDQTTALNWNDNAAAIQSALNNLSGLSAVTVTGTFATDYVVTFTGADGDKPHPLITVVTNTLEYLTGDVDIQITETTEGELPNVDVAVEADEAGDIIAQSGTLTVIETPIAGVDSVTNALDIDNGTNVETDAELRLRRLQTLATAGAATVDAITARMLEIDEVSSARTFENDSMVYVGSRPPKSFEVVVLGGVDQEIADEIWDVKAAGIETYGTTSSTVEDTEGFSHTVKFSRPDEVDIYMEIDLTKTSDFPVDGDDAVKADVVSYADDNFGIGDDVLTWKLNCPIKETVGITNCVIRIGTSPSPTGSSNIVIDDTEIAIFDTSRITINTV